MGVMGCHRNGCTNVMCNKLSDKFGYICNECFEELKNSGMNIASFMESPKGKDNYNYDKEFKSC